MTELQRHGWEGNHVWTCLALPFGDGWGKNYRYQWARAITSVIVACWRNSEFAHGLRAAQHGISRAFCRCQLELADVGAFAALPDDELQRMNNAAFMLMLHGKAPMLLLLLLLLLFCIPSRAAI